MCDKVFCTNCIRWYFTHVDQCEIPDVGLNKLKLHEGDKNYLIAIGEVDMSGIEFIKSHLEYIKYSNSNCTEIFGHPSQLNKNNDCYFYKPKKEDKKRTYNIWDFLLVLTSGIALGILLVNLFH